MGIETNKQLRSEQQRVTRNMEAAISNPFLILTPIDPFSLDSISRGVLFGGQSLLLVASSDFYYCYYC